MHVKVTDKKDGTAYVAIVGDSDAVLVSDLRTLPAGTARAAGADHDAVLRSAARDFLLIHGYVVCGDWAQQLEDRAWQVSILPEETGEPGLAAF